MNSTPEKVAPSIAELLLKDPKPEEIIDKLKSAKRDEVLSSLGALLNLAFRRGLNSKASPQVQQRWFTICGYLSQVMARVVRDLEYEKLRAEVEDLKKQVAAKIVHTTRRTRYSSRPSPNTKRRRG